MAFNLHDINATVREKFFPVAVDNVFTNILLFYRLLKRNKVKIDGAGRDGYVVQPIIAGKYPIFSHDNKFGKINVPTNQIMTYAKFRFATLYGALALTREDENILTSDAAVLDTIKVRFSTMVTSLIETIERKLFIQEAVTEGYPIDSLEKIIDNGDMYPEYAGLSRIEFPEWKSYVMNKNKTSLTYSDLSNVISKIQLGTESATIVLTTDALWTAANNLIMEKQRYALQDDSIANLGINNFKIFNAPCVKSPYVPADTMYFINENYLQLVLKQQADERGMTMEGYTKIDLATVKALQVFFDGQLYSSSPRMHGKIINALP